MSRPGNGRGPSGETARAIPNNNNQITAEQADRPSSGEVDARRQLQIRGIGDTDFVSFNRIDEAGNWRAERVPAVMVPHLQVAYASGDAYVGVNPIPAVGRGRGGSADITRLAALVAELDYDKLAPAACWAVIVTLAGMVGWPSLIVHSGHGLHVYWPVDPDDARALDRPSAAVLAARFGMLVAVIAGCHGGSVDTVSDLARVLRCVHTTNRKRSPAVKVVGYEIGRGCAVFAAQITAILDEFGIEELTADEAAREIVAPPSTWLYVPDRITSPCSYLDTVLAGWLTDLPRPGQGRHNWLIYQSCRLHGFVRRGCIGSAAHYEDLRSQLRTAFHMRIAGAWNTTPRGETPRNEFESALAYSIRRLATKTDADVLSETGHLHVHDKQAIEVAELAAFTKSVLKQ